MIEIETRKEVQEACGHPIKNHLLPAKMYGMYAKVKTYEISS
jgi:hypothetical protein